MRPRARADRSRYHLPGHVQAHVDYITPGIKHLATRGSDASLKKRNGWGKGKGHRQRPHPPPTRPMPPQPMPTNPANLTMCGTLVTPECIAVSLMPPS